MHTLSYRYCIQKAINWVKHKGKINDYLNLYTLKLPVQYLTGTVTLRIPCN